MKALLVIDTQVPYMKRYDKELIQKINNVIVENEKQNNLIIYIRNLRKPTLLNLKEEPFYPIDDNIYLASNNYFNKDKASAIFAINEKNETLINFLNDNLVKEIELIGVDGACCVYFTSNDLVDFGFTTIINESAIGLLNKERYLKRKEKLLKKNVIFKSNEII